MKKIFTLTLALLASFSTGYAQSEDEELDETFKFVTQDGTEVPNGSTWTVNIAELGDFGDTQLKSGLYLQNTLGERAAAQVTLDIQQIPNGVIQFCLLGKCASYNTPGQQVKIGMEDANKKDDLQLEWLPTAFGECTATVRADVLDYTEKPTAWGSTTLYGGVIGHGPQITLRFVYSDPTGVRTVTDRQTSVVARYNACGQRITAPQKGLNILVLSNGRTVKQFLK